MEFVEPIKDERKLKDLKRYLKGSGNMRNYCLVFLGLNIALRISDLTSLKWVDVLEEDAKTIRPAIYMREKKTNKTKIIRLNDGAKESITLYMAQIKKEKQPIVIDGFVFKSRQCDQQQHERPISRRMAWVIIKEACAGIGIHENIGTHTLRKTWGYWAFKGGMDIITIMHTLNHSDISVTKRYIGLTQDDINSAYDAVQF